MVPLTLSSRMRFCMSRMLGAGIGARIAGSSGFLPTVEYGGLSGVRSVGPSSTISM